MEGRINTLIGKEGPLKKKGKASGAWVKRWYSLGTHGMEGRTLRYWVSESDLRKGDKKLVKGVVDLKGAVAEARPGADEGGKHCLVLDTTGRKENRVITLYAATAGDRDEWVRALQAACGALSARTMAVAKPSFEGGSLLSPEQQGEVWGWLPGRHALRSARLAYSFERHGHSLSTMYRLAGEAGRGAGGDEAPCLLVAKTDRGEVLGAFTSRPWRQSEQYEGTGECFVFTLAPGIHKYGWSKSDEMFMLGGKSSLSVGGGAHPALWLDGDLLRGATAENATFGCPPLVPGSPRKAPGGGGEGGGPQGPHGRPRTESQGSQGPRADSPLGDAGEEETPQREFTCVALEVYILHQVD